MNTWSFALEPDNISSSVLTVRKNNESFSNSCRMLLTLIYLTLLSTYSLLYKLTYLFQVRREEIKFLMHTFFENNCFQTSTHLFVYGIIYVSVCSVGTYENLKVEVQNIEVCVNSQHCAPDLL